MNPQEFTPVEEITENAIAIVSEKNFELIFNGRIDLRIADVEKELKSILRKEVSDKKAYQDLKDLKNKVIVKMRTATVAKSKEMTEGYKKNIAKIKEVENSIIERVTKRLESKADERIEAYEKLIREEEEKAQREAKEKIDNRVKSLIESGIIFTGVWYSIGQIQVGIQMIQEMSDDDYNDLLSKVKIQNEANIAEQKRRDEEAEAERKKQEAIAEQNKKEKEELEAGRLELRSGQLELLGIAVTTEYELLMKTASNEEWKARYEELKSYKIKLNRIAELQPYIVYIKNYNDMIALDEESYQKELSIVKQAKIDQEEYNRQEALKELERQDREQKEKEAKIKQDRETLATNAKKYETIGFSYDFRQHRWFIQVGEYSTSISEDTMLNEKEGAFEVVKDLVETWRKELEKKQAQDELDRQAEIKANAEEAERKRKELLTETDLYNEYIGKLRQIEAPVLSTEILVSHIENIKELISTDIGIAQ